MGNPAGVKRDFEALEARRLEAVRLLKKGKLNQSQIARELKVCRQTVSRWAAALRTGGPVAMKKAGRAFRKPQLERGDRQRLLELLKRGPEALGYPTPLWTCWRVAHLIQSEFQVQYHHGHVWKIYSQRNPRYCESVVGRSIVTNVSIFCGSQ